MSLVHIAGIERDAGELVASASSGKRATQAQHTSQPLGPVADRRRHPAPQPAATHPELARESSDVIGAMPQAAHRRADERIGKLGAGGPLGKPGLQRPDRVVFALERQIEPRALTAQDERKPHALVTQRLGRTPSSAGADPGRNRAPSMYVSSATGTTNAVVLAPTIWLPAPRW